MSELAYIALLAELMRQPEIRQDRTGVGTQAVFGKQLRFRLAEGFPLLTTRRLHFKSIALELLWMLRGETNIRWLQAQGVSIWDEWADHVGDLGPIYGHQWRFWPGPGATGDCGSQYIDQIVRLVEGLRNDPYSRRHIVTAWNPTDLDIMALAPCHCMFQMFVAAPLPGSDDRRPRLSCQVYQRSADAFLGLPFNIASYALLTHMVAQVTGMRPWEMVHTLGDVHLYQNHQVQACELLAREPRPPPRLILAPRTELQDFAFEDIGLEGYDPHPAIAAEVAV